MQNRIYLGITGIGTAPAYRGEIFRSETEPTEQSHGKQYKMVIGPFRTIRGATFMKNHGVSNPHCCCVSEAERLAKISLDKQEQI